jgi:hypothetical protein
MSTPSQKETVIVDRKTNFHPLNKKLGEWLKAARLQAKIPLDQAAAAIEWDQEAMELAESGRRNLACQKIAKLVRLYQASPESLMTLLLRFNSRMGSRPIEPGLF